MTADRHDDANGAGDLSIGRLAALAGVTVRTLHHYDRVGLLRPAARSGSGYRRYGPGDVARLQRILFYRELELPLARIKALVDDPSVDERDHLRRQLAELDGRIDRLRRIRAAVQTTMEAHAMSIDLTPEERLEVFGTDDPTRYDEEAHQRWGDTDAYRVSRERTRRLTKEGWLEVRAEIDEIETAFARALATGDPATSPAAMDIAERARRHIDTRFYPLDHAAHCGLADLYVGDARFLAHYDARAPGLAQYVAEAIRANAGRHAGPAG